MNQLEFIELLHKDHVRKIYVSHYEDSSMAKKLAKILRRNGFLITIAEDVRKYGYDFMSRKISESDLLIVVNPSKDHSSMIINFGGGIVEIEE